MYISFDHERQVCRIDKEYIDKYNKVRAQESLFTGNIIVNKAFCRFFSDITLGVMMDFLTDMKLKIKEQCDDRGVPLELGCDVWVEFLGLVWEVAKEKLEILKERGYIEFEHKEDTCSFTFDVTQWFWYCVIKTTVEFAEFDEKDKRERREKERQEVAVRNKKMKKM